ncbi:hypothetical protein EVAR_53616_1 [Eumeta japonica]|uniref:Uncharacterized protein n=1 Tax=Eumeta variegata TaxID=151549 RepID=A0A4C1X0R8_EUMVA|nr:hypothetical protein EVAR_53616_1 [Eumeta japonica]
MTAVEEGFSSENKLDQRRSAASHQVNRRPSQDYRPSLKPRAALVSTMYDRPAPSRATVHGERQRVTLSPNPAGGARGRCNRRPV